MVRPESTDSSVSEAELSAYVSPNASDHILLVKNLDTNVGAVSDWLRLQLSDIDWECEPMAIVTSDNI